VEVTVDGDAPRWRVDGDAPRWRAETARRAAEACRAVPSATTAGPVIACGDMASLTRAATLCVLVACGSSPAPGPAPVPPPPAPQDHALHETSTAEPGGTRLRKTAHGLVLNDQPFVDWIGVPVSGSADLSVDLFLPDDHGHTDYRGATGELVVSCAAGCTIGDDHTPVQTGSEDARTARFARDLWFGHITIDRFEARITFANGRAQLTTWSVVSKDVQVELKLRLELARELVDSEVTGCLRVRATRELRARDTKLDALLAATGAPLDAEGLFNFRLAGRMLDIKRFAQICDGSVPLPELPATTATSDPLEPTSEQLDVVAAAEAERAALLARSITQLGPTSYEVDASLLDKLSDDPKLFLRGARLVPSMQNGKPDGFKVYAIRPSSVFARLGMANGDTVRTINGTELTSADKALEVYSALKASKRGDAIVVELVRRSKPMTLTYRVR